MQTTTNKLLALDVGTVRIGISMNPGGISIAQPHRTLDNTPEVFEALVVLVKQEDIQQLVVGLPRGLEGQETAQTVYAREFGEKLKAQCGIPVVFQDEALTSVASEQNLKDSKKAYTKADIDAQSATMILQDYLDEHGVNHG